MKLLSLRVSEAGQLVESIPIAERIGKHIDAFGLINMNGRMYDPRLGRFLSPDNYVQAPDYTQSFNRYSYAFNNPLMYTDPDGEWLNIAIGAVVGAAVNLAVNWQYIDNFWEGLAVAGVGAIGGAITGGMLGSDGGYGLMASIAAGAAIAATNSIIQQTNDLVKIENVDWGQVGESALIGGVCGGIGYYVGGITSSWSQALGAWPGALSGGLSGALVGGLEGGVLSGAISLLFYGGSFWDAFQTGFINGAMAGGIGGFISGGVNGYQLAEKCGANPWTGYKITNTKPYSFKYNVRPIDYDQHSLTDGQKYCYAFDAAFSNSKNNNVMYYVSKMDYADGAAMINVAKNCGATDYGAKLIMNIKIGDWDGYGAGFDAGYAYFITETQNQHIVTLTNFSVSYKANIFFGGNTQIISNVRVFDPMSGSIVPYNLNGSSVLTYVKW